jgi:N-methylhydantoinase A
MPSRANSIRRGSTIFYAGVDVGGSFTDVVVYDERAPEKVEIVKISTAKDPERAVVEALNKYRDSADKFSLITHATTAATNALLVHRGLAKTALITNRGFRDILEIGRQRRPELYNLKTQRPAPLVERKDRFTVRGRILSDGTEIEQLNEGDVKEIARQIQRSRFDSVAISLLNSYVNPAHERKVRDLLREAGFKGQIDISSEIDPAYREYERTSTSVVNATLAKPVSRYLARLEKKLRRIGFSCPIYVMNSDGTTSTIDYASRHPVSMIESGPAAGVLASKNIVDLLGLRKAITFDMGGTTAKAGTIIDGQPELAYEFEAAARFYHGRSIKGSGYPVRQPFIDLAEVSAGGGTIARLDDTGALKVGPESAGSDPGPAAYGKGGKEPTVTDANVVAGRINPSQLLGGNLKLHYELGVGAIKLVSRRLGETVDQTTADIVRIVNNNMSKAVRLVTIERGRDPREFALIAFGGAGPLHACDLAEQLGIKRIIVPSHPGLFSAFGLLTADLSRTFSEPILKPVTTHIESYFKRVRNRARRLLKQEGFTTYRTIEQIDLRYQGQAYEITVPYKKNTDLARLFGREHKKLYGYGSNDMVEAVNARIRAVIPTPKARIAKKKLQTLRPPAPSSSRRVLLLDNRQEIPIYNRENLMPGASGKGPSIIEEYDSTTMIGKMWRWKIDQYGDIDMLNTTEAVSSFEPRLRQIRSRP